MLPLLVAACSRNPAVVLSPVPAAWSSLECVGRGLDARGYEVRLPARDPNVMVAERRQGSVSSGARRDILQVRRVADRTGTWLRGSAWGVEYSPGFQGDFSQMAVVTDPSPQVLADAREVLQECGAHAESPR
jgi:hypothetical protein